MRKRFIGVLAFAILAITGIETKAQTIDLEKTYTITKQSKKGTLANVEFDEATGNYTLYYITKSNDKMAKIEVYVFDKDFNFVSQTDEEMEFEKVKTKYNWFSFKLPEYTVQGLFVEPNMMGTLVMKKKEISYSFDWLYLGYKKKVKVLEKLKPKSEDGLKYHYFTHFEDEANGYAYVLAGEKDKITKDADPNKAFTKMHLLKFNLDLEILGDVELSFDFPQSVVSKTYLPVITEDPDNPGMGDMMFVFAPADMGKGFKRDENKSNFTYVRVSPDMKLVDRISFESPAPGWVINDITLETTEDAVYLYGPSAEGKDSYWAKAITAKKFKAVQLMKVNDHKVEYLTSTNLEEFEAKLKTPPTQKKSPAYAGKKFKLMLTSMASNGDLFFTGQNFDTNKEGGIMYNDILGFHFDNKGVLKAQYGVDTYETNAVAKGNGAPQSLIEGASGKNVYWILNEIDGFAFSGRLLTYARIGKIDITSDSGGLTDFITLGGEAKKVNYFLDQKFPFLQTSKGNTVVFFGADKKGKTIWFCRVKID